ncbi:MAG: hypothetical protein Unbinned4466contig1000_19 [Prokaryotic dsDNA virus sp.]|nr:MAG: hypothetical protein Unbinned4466contig1000_19 [Prokaryotic dsDNA virus sp.]|tara:strand:+ start:4448 stop:4690 length:243 start_codon:yes stop_codon:yes gene_type:complete
MKFTPFNEPMPNIDYEYSPQETVSDVVNKMMRDFYEELEGVICCAMAAGVNANQIIMTEPKMITNGYEVKMGCNISFEGR